MVQIPHKYQFDYYYQMDVLRVCVQDANFLSRFPDTIQPNFFSTDDLMTIGRLIVDFHRQYTEPPSYQILRQSAAQYFAKFSVSTEIQNQIYGVIDEIYRMQPSNAQAVVDTVCRFAREQSLKRVINEVLTLFETGGNLDEVSAKVLTASTVGTQRREAWSFFQKIGDLKQILDNDPSYNPEFKILTPFKLINKSSFGGAGSGQIWTIGAKPKGGKTSLLVNFAAFAIYSGKCVYHYSFGDMNKMDVMMRYASRFAARTTEELFRGTDYVDICRSILDACPGADLQVIYESPFVMDADDVYADLSWRVAQTGRKPDLVVVDYANKMKFKHSDNSYRSMSVIYGGLKALGDAFQCPVFTGVQLKRGADRKDSAPEDVAESWLQIADCDAFILINQTEQEKANRHARLAMPIIRRGAAVPAVPVWFQPEICLFKDRT